MMERFEKREAFRAARQFGMTARAVRKAFKTSRPASAHRLNQASIAIVHFVIHSTGRTHRRCGQWRIARALAAAQAAHIVLKRLRKVSEHRAITGAAMETLERVVTALEKERV
jgi:hypothetical protein